jgi:hypothetical protein
MDSRVRRTVEMGRRALAFFEAHQDKTLATLPAVTRLKQLLDRADQLLLQQRDGINEVRAATSEKRELRRKIRRNYLTYLARVAEAAAVERPELARKLELPSEALPYLAFQTAVHGMVSEAQKEKELLMKYGLVEPALDAIAGLAAQFDQEVDRGINGRRAHVGARGELNAIGDEIIQQVRQLDGLARFKFAEDAEARAAWRSSSNTFGPPRSTGGEAEGRTGGASTPTQPQGGEAKPAA